MIAINPDYEPVDLATLDKGLAEIMITGYPGRITGEQYCVDTSDPDDTVYRFLSLPKRELLDFLKQYSNGFEYEVRRSWDGKPTKTNHI